MSIIKELEAAGEDLSPRVRAALVVLETRVQELTAHAQALTARVEELSALELVVAQLQAQVRELEARLAQNSTNSSCPPSADPPGTTRPARPERGRRRGGQPGHRGHHRAVLPPERVDAVVKHQPAACQRCAHPLAGAAVVGEPTRHQVIELPPVRAHVTEHQALTLACPGCGTHTASALPRPKSYQLTERLHFMDSRFHQRLTPLVFGLRF